MDKRGHGDNKEHDAPYEEKGHDITLILAVDEEERVENGGAETEDDNSCCHDRTVEGPVPEVSADDVDHGSHEHYGAVSKSI